MKSLREKFLDDLSDRMGRFSAGTLDRIQELRAVDAKDLEPQEPDACRWFLALPAAKRPLFENTDGPLLLPWQGCRDAEFYRWCVFNSLTTWSSAIKRFEDDAPDLFRDLLWEVPMPFVSWDEAHDLHEIRRAGYRLSLKAIQFNPPPVNNLSDLRIWCDVWQLQLRLVRAAFPSRPCRHEIADNWSQDPKSPDQFLCLSMMQRCVDPVASELRTSEFVQTLCNAAREQIDRLGEDGPTFPEIPNKDTEFSTVLPILHTFIEAVRHWSFQKDEAGTGIPAPRASEGTTTQRRHRIEPTANRGEFADPVEYRNNSAIAADLHCCDSTARRYRRDATLPFYYEGQFLVVSCARMNALRKPSKNDSPNGG